MLINYAILELALLTIASLITMMFAFLLKNKKKQGTLGNSETFLILRFVIYSLKAVQKLTNSSDNFAFLEMFFYEEMFYFLFI